MDRIADYTGGAGNNTFTGSKSDGTNFFTALDALDGGDGTDTLDITVTANFDSTAATGATVKNIENVNITSTGTVVADTSAWTGVTALTTASTGNSTLTAATTTNITASVANPTGAGAAAIEGGKDVTLTITDKNAADTASGNTSTLGATTRATGAIVVSQTETFVASADGGATALATGSITVNGGTSVTVNSLVVAGTGNNAGDINTIGTVTVNGKGTATSVSVTQSAATAAYANAGDKQKITNGVVTITDNNTATKADTITTVSLNYFGNSTITGNALTTLNLTGGGSTTASGTLAISQSAGLTTSAPTELTINMAKGTVGVITDTNDQYKTVNVVSAAAATIGGLDFTEATSLAVSGAGVTTITANTDIGKVTSITSTGAGLTMSAAIGTGVAFTGGDGKETVSIGATTKAITTGAGDDKVTIGATSITGSVDAGDGVDTLSMAAADAVTASATTTFETKITGFEKLSLAAVAASGTVALANLDDLNDVAIAGVDVGQALTLSGAQSGINLRFADATQTSTIVTLANNGSADVANVFLTTADEASTLAALDLTGFETINITSSDTDTNTTAASNALTALTAAAAKSIVVTGNAGFALANGFTGTALTSFDAAGVTAGAVTYTSGALAGAATIKGGAGNDTLNAAAAVAAVTIQGGAGNDTITGSSTKANTLHGDAGNDTLTGGKLADTIDGGDGTDTFVANLTEQAGSGTTDGAVINLSDTALTQSGVFTLTGKYLATVNPSVASNTATYLYSNESSTNDNVVDTLISIENATGTSGVDYIVGSSAANVIEAAAGRDYITTGGGIDTVKLAAVDIAGSVDGGDVITDFTKGTGGDIIKVSDADFAWFNGTSDGTVVLATGATLDAAHAANNNFTVATISTNVATHTVATFLAGTSTIAQLEGAIATALGAAADLSFANTDKFLVAIDDGASTMLVRVESAADGAAIAAAELSLVGILQGVSDATTLVASNFSFAA